jgi:bacterioferritin
MNNFEDIEEKIDKFLETLPCQSDMPFPPIKVERQNPVYATLLLDAFASSADSEIQAITQYIYHSKTISNNTISNALMCIALIEMRHLDTLSELIPMLGGKPFYENSNKNFWMTGNIAYIDKNFIYEKEHFNTGDNKDNSRMKLEANIDAELNAINGYHRLLRNIEDKYIEKIIVKIISDEQAHIKIFETLIDKYLLK